MTTQATGALLAGLCLCLALLAGEPAAAFSVRGAAVDLTPMAPGGELDLRDQVDVLNAARAAADPTAGLVDIMARLETIENRRAAFAWLVATSARPAIDATAALYGMIRAGVVDGRQVLQAVVFAQARGVRALDLYRWAAAAGLPEPALGQLARLAASGGGARPAPQVTGWTAPAPAAGGA